VNDFLSTWQTGRRRRGDSDGCLSNLALDRLAQGECTPGEQEQARAHLQTCAGCKEAAAALSEEQRRFAEETDIPALARDALARASGLPAPASRWSRWLTPVLGVGMAAAGLLLLTRQPQTVDRAGDMRAKGGFAVELYVKHAEGAAEGRLHQGEPLHPGDRVRLRLVDPGRGAGRHVAVLAIDTSAKVSVYYPQADTTAELAEGANAPLPSAVELDGTLGGEVLVAFSCAQRQPVQSLVAAVQQALDPAVVRTDPAAALGTIDTPCVSTRYRINKLPRAGAP
jgi:hypothetical protein